MEIPDEFDGLSVPDIDQVSCCSETPTNTPSVGMFSNGEKDIAYCGKRANKEVKEEVEPVNEKGVGEREEKAFADHEEICQCMCSVLQTIDYVGSKGLRNIKKLRNVIKSDSNKQDGTVASRQKNEECEQHEKAPMECKNGTVPNRNDVIEYRKKYPSFRCYCCPEKHSIRTYIENIEKLFPRQNSGESVVSISPESKSCVCGEGESSEYESETRSNLCTLSRNSSCGSCSDYFKRFESRSQDSDYGSIANEDNVNETIGIVLDLQEITDNVKSEKAEDDEFLGMNLTEFQLLE